MKELLMKSFKAHKELKVDFDNKSFLLYGDNGAGKSSIYDALKLIFFKEKIENSIESYNIAEEVAQADRDEFFSKYNNTILKDDFEIKLNNDSFEVEEHQVFMLNLDDTEFEKSLTLLNLLEKIYFQIPDDSILKYKKIEDNANNILDYFKEDIFIEIDNEDNYSIRITDEKRGLSRIKDIKRYFNEAKLNLVVFALLFSIVEIFQDKSKQRIFIFDDFITSLDMSNRTFLMRHILGTFQEFQIVILTHNVYFYNLIMYLINEIYKINSKWRLGNLYEINNEHKLYINPSNKMNKRLKLKVLEDKLNTWNENWTNEDIKSIGNEFRQKFEILLYEFSKILMIGGVEETKNILDILIKKENLYFWKDGNQQKGSIELIQEIEKTIKSGTTDINDILNILEKYRVNNFNEIKQILQSLKLFQKVQMHPLSHGQIAESYFSKKEGEESLLLLTKLEKNIFDLMHKTVN